MRGPFTLTEGSFFFFGFFGPLFVGGVGGPEPPGPSATGSLGRRMNCHQTKKLQAQMKTRIETQAFRRSPRKWWEGSIRSSSMKKRMSA